MTEDQTGAMLVLGTAVGTILGVVGLYWLVWFSVGWFL